jgi:hypothetical protein
MRDGWISLTRAKMRFLTAPILPDEIASVLSPDRGSLPAAQAQKWIIHPEKSHGVSPQDEARVRFLRA